MMNTTYAGIQQIVLTQNRMERCQHAVVWWWPEFKFEESIPKVIRNQVGTEMENENWEDAYEIMAEYLAT